MTGDQLYSSYRAASSRFGINVPSWMELTPAEKQDWDVRAYEQDLRDRPVSDRVAHGKDW